MLDPLILRIISVGFALLFIFAAAHKFNNKLQFLGILEAYQILPGTMPGLAVNVIPALELMLGLAWALTALLLVQITLLPLMSAMLLFTYAMAIAINLFRGRSYIDCGCGFSSLAGSARSESNSGGIQQLSKALVLRNCVLGVVALIAAASPSSRDLGFMDFLSLVTASFTLVLLYGAFNQLLVNRNIIGAWLNPPRSNSHG
ncbi:MAG TPA: hypothetical protein EYO00_05220 [Gammaproteobacteria bacterium]|jgi:hypothetical protein|nr:hypothetical protein [Gammaproteobacteria bacterium]HIF87609.1 hypothetical protein [Gammaproteobacteria bacterium]HIL62429.1 hypothetical protein [Porticoccaceae bacterium]HIN89969.1 hypothetical protein [Porticoccaceae bacterium]|tara:strand:- start:1826 stop:2431 length:606 start_codon:yes stop_codon:yes gene_type:complete